MNETHRYLLERLRKQIFSYGSLCSLYAELIAKNVNGEYCHEIRGKREEAVGRIRMLLREIQAQLAYGPVADDKPRECRCDACKPEDSGPCCEDIGEYCCVRDG